MNETYGLMLYVPIYIEKKKDYYCLEKIFNKGKLIAEDYFYYDNFLMLTIIVKSSLIGNNNMKTERYKKVNAEYWNLLEQI